MKKNAPTKASLLACGILVGALGCTESGDSLIILQNQVAGEGCVISASSSNTFVGRGLIDSNSSIGYVFNPLVQNLATAGGGSATRIAFIEGYEVEISFPGDSVTGVSSELTGFSSLVSGSITPGGFAGLSFEVVPPALLAELTIPAGEYVELLAEVTVFGTMDGGEVESNQFRFPIDVCDGCLISNNGPCTDIDSDFTPRTGGVCNPLQDKIIDCCTLSDGGTLCPAETEEIVTP